MNRPLIVCAVLLGVSVLVNAMAVGRLLAPAESPAPRPPRAATPGAAPDAPAVRDDDSLDLLRDEVSRLRQDIAALKQSMGVRDGTPAPAPTTSPAARGPRVRDPKIAEILGESEPVDNLFSDLGRLARNRDEIGKEKFQQTALESTADALGLVEPARSRFIAAAQQVAAELEVAWKVHEDARKALPPFDPANREANREQYSAINKAFQEQAKAAAVKLTAALDASQPTQKVFMAKADDYATRFLAPPGADRVDRFDRGMRRVNR